MRSFLLLLFTFGWCAGASAQQRADAIKVDGIYTGSIGMQLDNRNGKGDYKAPAKFVVMPDGKAAVLTAQHPDGVLSVVMRGELRNAVFIGKSGGKTDFGGYTNGMTWDIKFDLKAGTADLHGKASDIPKWAHDDDLHFTFHKQVKR